MLKCVDLTKVRIFYIHRLAAGDTSSISELKMLLRCFVQRNTDKHFIIVALAKKGCRKGNYF